MTALDQGESHIALRRQPHGMGAGGRIAEAEPADFLPARDIPDAHRAVAGSGNEPPAVGREGEAHHPVAVALEEFQLLAGAGVPQDDVVRRVAYRQRPAVRREGQGERAASTTPAASKEREAMMRSAVLRRSIWRVEWCRKPWPGSVSACAAEFVFTVAG
jgi:hypothetical protein